jgi:phage gpG-like protein
MKKIICLTKNEAEVAANVYASLAAHSKACRAGCALVALEDLEYYNENVAEDVIKAFNTSFDADGTFNAKGTAEFIRSKVQRVKISDSVAKEVYKSLPKNVKHKLNTGGDPRSGAWNGAQNARRGQALLKRYMEQNSIDPYTGKKVDLMLSEVEHIVPDNLGKQFADQPDNWAIIAADINKFKSNKSGLQMQDSINKLDKVAYLNKTVKNKAKAVERSYQRSAVPEVVAKAFDSLSPALERQNYARQIAESMKTKSKKLLSGSGLPESYQELRPQFTQDKNRTKSVDDQATLMYEIFETKQKASSLVFQALAFTSDNPEVNNALRAAYVTAIVNRKLNFKIARKIYNTKGKIVFAETIKCKTKEFAEALKTEFDKISGFKYN